MYSPKNVLMKEEFQFTNIFAGCSLSLGGLFAYDFAGCSQPNQMFAMRSYQLYIM